MFEAQNTLEALQDAVQRHDRERVAEFVSDRMIWVLPLADNERGKTEWIDASCAVNWHWFEISISREVDLGDVRIVEALVRQSRDPSSTEETTSAVIAEGVVVDVWALEDDTWRLVARHPHRIS